MEIILSIIQFLIEFIQKSTDISKELPAFKVQGMYLPGRESNPLIFLCKITNKSERAYVINEALISKLNEKEQFLLVSFKAVILVPNKKIPKTREILGNWENTTTLLSDLPNWKEVDELKFESKKSLVVAFLYNLTEDQLNYWSNFETRMVNPGIILEDKIFPAWFESIYEWSLILKDEHNGYWGLGNDRDYLSPQVDYPIYQEKRRLITPFQYNVNLGILKIFDIVRIKRILLKYSINYSFRKLLYKLKFVKSL